MAETVFSELTESGTCNEERLGAVCNMMCRPEVGSGGMLAVIAIAKRARFVPKAHRLRVLDRRAMQTSRLCSAGTAGMRHLRDGDAVGLVHADDAIVMV